MTHWLTTIATIALVIIGLELIISYPRFRCGEVGNVNTAPIFSIPSRRLMRAMITGGAETTP